MSHIGQPHYYYNAKSAARTLKGTISNVLMAPCLKNWPLKSHTVLCAYISTVMWLTNFISLSTDTDLVDKCTFHFTTETGLCGSRLLIFLFLFFHSFVHSSTNSTVCRRLFLHAETCADLLEKSLSSNYQYIYENSWQSSFQVQI